MQTSVTGMSEAAIDPGKRFGGQAAVRERRHPGEKCSAAGAVQLKGSNKFKDHIGWLAVFGVERRWGPGHPPREIRISFPRVRQPRQRSDR
jgi:hypothetical protein